MARNDLSTFIFFQHLYKTFNQEEEVEPMLHYAKIMLKCSEILKASESDPKAKSEELCHIHGSKEVIRITLRVLIFL